MRLVMRFSTHKLTLSPFKVRHGYPRKQILGRYSMIIIMLAFFLGGAQTATGTSLSWLGVFFFGCTTLFTFVTLPVEFDASKRALASLKQGNYVTEKELNGAEKVMECSGYDLFSRFYHIFNHPSLLGFPIRLTGWNKGLELHSKINPFETRR